MNILALFSNLGHALVAWGLGGPANRGAGSAIIPYPVVTVAITRHSTTPTKQC